MTWISRSAGWLLPVSALPSGRLDNAALRLLDLASQAGLRVWQILPIGPPAKFDNPFEPASAFALDRQLFSAPRRLAEGACDEYRSANADWLEEWALFAALKEEQGGEPWWRWPPELRHREAGALARARARLAAAIGDECLRQCVFEAAWAGFRDAARERGVKIFGDVPLFVSHDSADVWAERHLFEVDAEGQCEATVGVPPDAFSATGQLWGFPPYRWDAMARDAFRWWKRRFEVHARRCDLVRIDHFRGLAAWWRVPAGARDATQGQWIPGPGAAAIECLNPVLGASLLVAEDLGMITDDVVELRRRLRIPGMRVLQFAFDGDPDNPHLPANHGADTVCYTGTHDNDTTLGWWRSLPPHERSLVARGLGDPDPAMPHALIQAAWSSPAPLAIVPVQDLLGLGSEARMNRPGITEGNWRWRLRPDQIGEELASRLQPELRRHHRA